jgi:hypothetical protein
MRFMMILIPKGYESAAPDALLDSPEDVQKAAEGFEHRNVVA